jgi:signal transduction histidine kinase
MAIAQQLVEVVRQVLSCLRVAFVAMDAAGYVHPIAQSGFTLEEQASQRALSGRYLPSELVDEATMARLRANEAVLLSTAHIRVPPNYLPFALPQKALGIPVLLDHQFAGGLVIYRAGSESTYTPDEIDVARAVVSQATLIFECVSYLHDGMEAQIRELVLAEARQLINEFLTLASHELRTPLTVIKGNLQLAERRLERLKTQITEQAGPSDNELARSREPLALALSGTQLQESIINDLLDDARLQANDLQLTVSPCDLYTLVELAVTRQQESLAEKRITFEATPDARQVPIVADAARITRVLEHFLAYAQNQSPEERPVVVTLRREDGAAPVTVHSDGLGLSPEEQAHLWERFSRVTGKGAPHSLDLGTRLGFYLCRQYIERHHGTVGVQSAIGHGMTLWFTLPVATRAAHATDNSLGE